MSTGNIPPTEEGTDTGYVVDQPQNSLLKVARHNMCDAFQRRNPERAIHGDRREGRSPGLSEGEGGFMGRSFLYWVTMVAVAAQD